MYHEAEPDPVVLQLAREPPNPTLPIPVQHRAAPKTRRERIPLLSSLEGPGRAGTETTLVGSHGTRYVGQVLAGRPHGQGQYWAPGVRPGQPLQLEYEGQFCRGVREGQGTAHFNSRGETYSGCWQDGRRTGPGTLTYADGAVFDGMWRRDVRHGVGTLYSPSASIFVGTFVGDKRQGLGVTYWGGRCRKYVAEYVDDSPTCGAVLSLEDDTVEAPATQQLRDAIAAARVTAAGLAVAAEADGSGCGVGGVPEMPELTLMQPSKVLAKEFGAVRQWRERQQQQLQRQQGKSGAGASPASAAAAAVAAAAVDPGTGTLTANTISLLRHAFILIAGGDDVAVYVLPHQLQELVVLAGLDPAAPAVSKLLGLLQGRLAEGKLFLDDLLDVAVFYRQTPLSALMAVPAGVSETSERAQEEEAGGGVAEVWRQEEEGDGSDSCGGGTPEPDMLAQHIAAHQPREQEMVA